jgi:lipopolysaccharide/colanic/teichoic acid biosynthesis glycosyltransferase
VTIGGRDPRVTRSGYIFRKFKIDELPQLINVFIGDMSLVGPRPEVRHYVNYWTPEQMHVLDVRPGITDPASIKFRNENELMEKAEDPEKYYIEVIMQEKIKLYLEYVEKILGRPIWTHELAMRDVQNEIHEKSKDDFISLCKGE